MTHILLPMSMALLACAPPEEEPVAPSADERIDPLGTFAPTGDAQAGRQAILDGEYIQCGVPRDWAELYWGTDPAYQVEGRSPENAELPYYLTATSSESGVELVTTNCLYCHGDWHYDEIVLGLGDTESWFGTDQTPYARAAADLARTEAERIEVARWADRVIAVSPYILTDTVGMNPADNLAQALFAHRDPQTLAWSSTPTMDPPLEPVPTDVPPLWNLRKKDRMLYTGSGRGNLARIMMTATVLCTESTEDADALYPEFQDIWAWMAELEPPPVPSEVDADLADDGQSVFEEVCAGCHGTYGDDWTYPNRVVPLAEVGTDPTLLERFAGDGRRFGDWFNRSWYARDAELVEPEGYIAPPLDGIWATAPYLHNGSVPTLAHLLDSPTRPTYWVRTGYQSQAPWVGLAVEAREEGREVDDDPNLYDTTRPGYDNGGHTFGDALTDAERVAVIEYLRTL